MHTFYPDTGTSLFEFSAASNEQVWLVGDFNSWGRMPLPMRFDCTRWVLKVRLPAGRYSYGFLLRDGLYCFEEVQIPLYFGKLDEEWLRQAALSCTCNKHHWKWN